MGLLVLVLPYVKIINVPSFLGTESQSLLVIYKEKTENPYNPFVSNRDAIKQMMGLVYTDTYYRAYKLPYLLFWE